jgi:hypothetical protein
VVAGGGELPVGGDHHDRVAVPDGRLDVPEPVLLEQRALPQRRLHQRVRGGLAVPRRQPPVQRADVHPGPGGDAGVRGGPGDLPEAVAELRDVAGVDPDRGAAGLDRPEDVPGLEVDPR